MDQKIFRVFKNGPTCAIQVGDDIVNMDKKEQTRVKSLFERALNELTLVPDGMIGCLLMYDNGIIATSLTIGRLDLEGTKFLLLAYTMNPEKNCYEVNSFLLTNVCMRDSLAILSK